MRPGDRPGRRLGWTVVLLLALAPASRAQDRTQFRTTVELVQLQVGVADARGSFVRGLGAQDFRLRVNGEWRPAQVAYEVDLRGSREPATPGTRDASVAAADRRARPVAARRHFLLFFDFSFTTRRGVLEARRAALQFVKQQVRAEDLLGVATASRYGIFLLSPFTSDHARALETIRTLGLVDSGDIVGIGQAAEESIQQALGEMSDAGGLAALPAMNFREYVANVSNYTDQLQEFGEMLQAIEGRKHVIMFSHGFDDLAITGQSLDALAAGAEARALSPAAVAASDPEMMFGAAEVRDSVAAAIEQFRSADAVIHAVDPAGLGRGSEGRQSLVALADGTGGTLSWNMNDISVALAQIEAATSTYYMIAYRKAAVDPPTVEVEVEVMRPGVEVVAAPTRLTPPPAYASMSEMQRQLQLAEYFNDDVEHSDIDFDSQVVTFPNTDERARAVVMIEVPGSELARLAAARGDDLVELELGGFALDDSGRVRGSFKRGARIDIRGMAARGSLQGQSFLFNDLLDTPVGSGSLRLLVREQRIGRLSSRTQHFWAPGSQPGLRLLRPLVLGNAADAVAPRADDGFDPLEFGGARRLAQARPELMPGESFELVVVALHVPRHPVTGELRAVVVLEAEDATGEPYPVGDFEVLGSRYFAAADATQLLLRARMPDRVPVGSIHLWARIIDSVTGNRVEEQTPVVIRSR